jgi:hypothetical protein
MDFLKEHPEQAASLLNKLPGGLGDKLGGLFG